MSTTLASIPLNPVPSIHWQVEYDRLTRDGWLREKIDRERRLAEHESYIDRYCPELRTAGKAWVVDLGPGPGEFLEIARSLGRQVLGVDAISGSGGMGEKYLQLSRLMTRRQRLPVEYVGAESWLERAHPSLVRRVLLINSRGSIEQILHRFLDGPPHDWHHDCKRLTWRISGEIHDVLVSMFSRMKALLRPDGCILVHANGSRNVKEYDTLIQSAAEEAGLERVLHVPPRLHKWRTTDEC